MTMELKSSNIVLFGAGRNGRQILRELLANGIKPAYLVDNNPNIKGIEYDGITEKFTFSVMMPEVLCDEDKRVLKVVVTPENISQREEITTQMRMWGLVDCLYKLNNDDIKDNTELPVSIRLEASTLCQLDCPACGMRKDNYGALGAGYLKLTDFKQFVNRHAYIRNIELANFGEIFLNPDLKSIIEYANEWGVYLTANSGVNLNNVSEDVLDCIVRCGNFKEMTISIDGVTQEEYSLYRRNGNYDTVIENIRKINTYKERYATEHPRLKWQYVIREHNEDGVPRAKIHAQELNMEISFKPTWEHDYKPKKLEMLKAETGLKCFTRKECEEESLDSPEALSNYMLCHQLWDAPQINWDGRLLGCCSVRTSDFGVNVFDVGLEYAINTESYKCAKQLVQGKCLKQLEDYNICIPCLRCSTYISMLNKNSFCSR